MSKIDQDPVEIVTRLLPMFDHYLIQLDKLVSRLATQDRVLDHQLSFDGLHHYENGFSFVGGK